MLRPVTRSMSRELEEKGLDKKGLDKSSKKTPKPHEAKTSGVAVRSRMKREVSAPSTVRGIAKKVPPSAKRVQHVALATGGPNLAKLLTTIKAVATGCIKAHMGVPAVAVAGLVSIPFQAFAFKLMPTNMPMGGALLVLTNLALARILQARVDLGGHKELNQWVLRRLLGY